MRPRLPAAISDAYRLALVEAERETGLPEETFPETCPWPVERLLEQGILPD